MNRFPMLLGCAMLVLASIGCQGKSPANPELPAQLTSLLIGRTRVCDPSSWQYTSEWEFQERFELSVAQDPQGPRMGNYATLGGFLSGDPIATYVVAQHCQVLNPIDGISGNGIVSLIYNKNDWK